MKLHNRIDANLQIQGCNERNSCGISAPNLLPLCRWILRIVGPPRIVFVPIIQRIEFMTVLSTGLKGGYNWVKFLLILFGSYVFKKSHFQSKCNRKKIVEMLEYKKIMCEIIKDLTPRDDWISRNRIRLEWRNNSQPLWIWILR